MGSMQLFNRHMSGRSVAVFTSEILLISGSLAIAVNLYGSPGGLSSALWKIALVTVLCGLCLYYNNLYDLPRVRTSRELVGRLFQAIGVASILLAALSLLAPSLAIGDAVFLSSLTFVLIAVPVWRAVLGRLTRASPMRERVLVVGIGETARIVAAEMLQQDDFGYEVVGFISADPSRVGQKVLNPSVVGTPDDLGRIITEHSVDRIVVGLPDRRGTLPLAPLLEAKVAGVRVEDAAAMYERLTGKILIDDLRPSALIFSDGFRVWRTARAFKRGFDVALALVGLVLAAPLIVLAAIAVRLGSGRPILYRQERVGEHGRIFTLVKFRSMRLDAEQGTPVWARSDDERVTWVGQFLRLTRLDELPQLWNVLRGDMSFVGPRPERPFFVEQLARQIPFYQQRHAVKPGVTGWAQVKYRYGASLEDAMEKLRYDLYYVKHMSILFDLTIIMDTVKVVLLRQGAQ